MRTMEIPEEIRSLTFEQMNGRRRGDRILFPLSEGAYTVVVG